MCGWWENPSLLLQVMQTLLGSLQALQVLHHLLHVILGVAILDVGKPAAAHAYDYGHDQHEVLQVVVPVHWSRERQIGGILER